MVPLGETLVAIGISALAGAAWVWHRGRRRPPPVTAGAAIARAPDRLAVLSAPALLAPHPLLLQHIERDSRLSQEVFRRECLPLLQAFAQFVQGLPASESHHHAQPGGLLAHALESAAHALRLRRGMLLPQGASIEDLPRLQHAYSWIVLAGALLHDVAKPLTDIRVTWFGRDAGAGQTWSPVSGSLPDLGALDYTVDFVPGRDYGAHARLPLVLLQRLAPASALRWVAQTPAVLDELTRYLAGEGGEGALAKLIREADAASVRENLRTGSRVRFASARAVPLIERLMAGLRRMLAEGLVPLNRSGACGWVFEGDLWLVAGRIADELRAYLQAHEVDGGAGVPGHDKNDRLFDALQDYGACLPTPEGRAVWRVRIDGVGYSHELTCLRFPVRTLFADAARAPAPMTGRVDVLSAAPATAPVTGAEPATAGSVPAPAAEPPPAPDGPSSGESAQASAPREEFLDRESLLDNADTASHAAAAAPALAGPVAPAVRALPPLPGAAQPPPVASRFMGWLQAGLASGQIGYNAANAAVHFVAEGMLIVSPRAFVEFITACGPLGDGTRPEEAERKSINRIQGALAKAGWSVPVALPKGAKGNIHKYQTVKRGSRGAVLSGVLLADPQRFVSPVPPPNPLLEPAQSA